MYICMTEDQKKAVVEIGKIMVVEFKRLLNQIVDAWNWFIGRIKRCIGNLAEFGEHFRYLPPKEKYKTIRRLNKCGYTEKEISMMVHGAYHCRNNC